MASLAIGMAVFLSSSTSDIKGRKLDGEDRNEVLC